jgi:nicotinate dehydrogenase subunit B
MPGVIEVVRDGSFLGVIAAREFQAIEAMRALAAAARWEETAQLPNAGALPDFLMAQPSRDITVLDARQPGSAARTLSATYTRPYIAHGSIGPSCAIAHYEGNALTVWTHSQGVYPLRDAIAEMLGMAKDKVRCIHAESAGCYGPQRRRRCCGRRRLAGAGRTGTTGAAAMDARTRARRRALRPGHGR